MDFYKTIARGYDGLYAEEQRSKLAIIKGNLPIKNSDLLLDVGCGTGLSSDFSCRVIGLEPSFELLAQSKGKAKVMARAENMPFRDGTFDKVISITSMHNFDDIIKGLEEIKRVGKNDFVFSVLKKSKNLGLIEKEIKANFIATKIIDGDKDWIFICGAKELN